MDVVLLFRNLAAPVPIAQFNADISRVRPGRDMIFSLFEMPDFILI
jgi:hypothetical protein